MAMTEKTAAARVFNIARELYSLISRNGATSESSALLDAVSSALSHCESTEKPLAKCMRMLKKQLKHDDREFYRTVKKHFSRLRPTLDYNFEKAKKHIPAIIYGNDMICKKLETNERDKARSMADAMKSYPGFLFGEFEALSDEQFYDLVFGFYPKLYEEPFMEEMRNLFI